MRMPRREQSIPVPAVPGGAMLNLLRLPFLRSRHARIPAVTPGRYAHGSDMLFVSWSSRRLCLLARLRVARLRSA